MAADYPFQRDASHTALGAMTRKPSSVVA